MFKKISAIIVAVALTVSLIPASFAFAANGEGENTIAAPTNVKADSDSDSNDVSLTWTKSSGASYYLAYRSKKAKMPAKSLPAKIKSCKYNDKNLEGGKYYYWIVAVAQDGTRSEASSPAIVKVSDYLTTDIRTIKWYAKIKNTMTLKKQTIKKGTRVKVTKHSKVILFFDPKRIYIIAKSTSGKTVKGWIKLSAVKYSKVYGDVSYSKKKKKVIDWTVKRKEEYVNSKGFSSSSKYLIWTSEYTQKVNIFEGKKGHWNLIKSFRCTTGKFSNPTKRGKYRLKKHRIRRQRTNTNTGTEYYYTHLTIFRAGDAFHSISWRIPDGKVIKNVKRNAQPQTLGCVRVSTANAKYIYYKLPLGTRVINY